MTAMRTMKAELRRVLVVDDGSTLAELMTMALRMEKWDVRTARAPWRTASPASRRAATTT